MAILSDLEVRIHVKPTFGLRAMETLNTIEFLATEKLGRAETSADRLAAIGRFVAAQRELLSQLAEVQGIECSRQS